MKLISRADGLTLLKNLGAQWSQDNVMRLSAALAYYSIFSIAPLLVIALSIAGWVLGPEAAWGKLSEQLRGIVGQTAADAVQSMIKSAAKPSASIWAGAIGAITLLVGASSVFGQLKDALNIIWKVRPKSGLGVMSFVRNEVLSFGMVLALGFLLLSSLLLTAALAVVTKYLSAILPVPPPLLALLGFVLSFSFVTVLFALIFKVLPDAKVRWKEVWIGAAFTAFLFEVGKSLMGFYLGRESTASSYGAAASVILLLLWIYYSSVILFTGAEFTQVYAAWRGVKVSPLPHAEPIEPVPETSASLPQKSVESVASQAAARPLTMQNPWTEFPAPYRPRQRVGSLPYPAEHPITHVLAALFFGLGAGLVARLVRSRD